MVSPCKVIFNPTYLVFFFSWNNSGLFDTVVLGSHQHLGIYLIRFLEQLADHFFKALHMISWILKI